MIKEYIADGKIVPMEVTVQLLENAMTEEIKSQKEQSTVRRFLIDGIMDPSYNARNAMAGTDDECRLPPTDGSGTQV